jgi:hypothetical protein
LNIARVFERSPSGLFAESQVPIAEFIPLIKTIDFPATPARTKLSAPALFPRL